MSTQYTIGLDYGTNSVRALIVNVDNGAEVATAVWGYSHGTAGVILSRDPNLARQHPADYLTGAEITIKQAPKDERRSVTLPGGSQESNSDVKISRTSTNFSKNRFDGQE